MPYPGVALLAGREGCEGGLYFVGLARTGESLCLREVEVKLRGKRAVATVGLRCEMVVKVVFVI